MYWDNIGSFQRYELGEGIYLEKAGGEACFTAKEYQLLQKILQDKHSPFKDYKINEIVTSDQSYTGEIDAFTGATILELGDSVSVKGAALTCYTLWHWANGPITDSIRQISAKSLSDSQLRNYLDSVDNQYKIFALEQFEVRRLYDSLTLKSAIHQFKKAENNLSKLILDYIEHTPDSVFFEALLNLLQIGDNEQRLLCLNRMIQKKVDPPFDYFDQLAPILLQSGSYQLIDVYLNIVERKTIISDQLIPEVLILLEEENFLIARRAFYFLKSAGLDDSQEKVCSEFYLKYKDSL